ncbi:MAG: zinc ribbon domain-containing protein [Clostridia bacterium]|nr:zinc ribbon domain-containing protein [Clostridia bacterium]
MAKFCVNCGAPLTDGAAFCMKCGASVPKEAAQPQPQPVPQPQPTPQPQPQYNYVQPQPAPKAKANSGSVMKIINAVLLLAVLALIIVGAITIPGNLKTETLPPVGFADVQPDAEVDADYETLASGGTLLGEATDDDWAAYVTHETPEWYYADEDE